MRRHRDGAMLTQRRDVWGRQVRGGRAREGLVAAALLALLVPAAGGCVRLDECSKDSDCPAGAVCVQATGGWVTSSYCAAPPADDAEADSGTPVCGSCLDDGLGVLCLSDGVSCGLECPAGAADCDDDPANGCETDVASDPTHCGGCARECATEFGTAHVVGTCEEGTCVATRCEAQSHDLDGQLATGCEVGVAWDEAVQLSLGGVEPVQAVRRTDAGTAIARGGGTARVDWVTDDGTTHGFVLLDAGVEIAAVRVAETPGGAVIAAVGQQSADGVWFLALEGTQLRVEGTLFPATAEYAAEVSGVYTSTLGEGDLLLADDGQLVRLRLQTSTGPGCTASLGGRFLCSAGQDALGITSVERLLALPSLDAPLAVALGTSEITQFRLQPSSLGEQPATSQSGVPHDPIDAEPWVDAQGVTRGIAILEPTRVVLAEFVFDGEVLVSRDLSRQVTLPAGGPPLDLVAVGGERFVVVTGQTLLLLSARPNEPQVVSVPMPVAGPQRWLGGAFGGGKLALATEQGVALVPLTTGR